MENVWRSHWRKLRIGSPGFSRCRHIKCPLSLKYHALFTHENKGRCQQEKTTNITHKSVWNIQNKTTITSVFLWSRMWNAGGFWNRCSNLKEDDICVVSGVLYQRLQFEVKTVQRYHFWVIVGFLKHESNSQLIFFISIVWGYFYCLSCASVL